MEVEEEGEGGGREGEIEHKAAEHKQIIFSPCYEPEPAWWVGGGAGRGGGGGAGLMFQLHAGCTGRGKTNKAINKQRNNNKKAVTFTFQSL